MLEQFVKRKGRREIQTTHFNFQFRCDDYSEGGRRLMCNAAKNISRPMNLKNYINTRFPGLD